VNHVAFPKIKNLYSIVSAREFTHTVTYRSKIKLHGTNAAVQKDRLGSLRVQSRNHVVKGSHFGFYDWVMANSGVFDRLPEDTTIFGEWCGPGIQKGVALSKIPRKIFAVFMAIDRNGAIITEPDHLRAMVVDHPDVFVLPWFGLTAQIDFSDPAAFDAGPLNTAVDAIEIRDPFCCDNFDVEGIGEGLVMFPDQASTVDEFSLMAFKAKGKLHRGSSTREAVQVDVPSAETLEAFISLVVTQARFEQALKECAIDVRDIRKLGSLLSWMHKDIQAECVAELAASGLTWKDVQKRISTAVRDMYLDQKTVDCGK
jgi:hypothetical protein